MMPFSLPLSRAVTLVLALMGALSAEAGAQSANHCRVLCKPNLNIAPSVTRNHLSNAPRVRSLTDGSEKTLPAHTNLELDVVLTIPTALPRTSLGLTVSWLPNASASHNPFTQYSASEVDEADIRTNLPSVTGAVSYTLVTKAQTGGWLSLAANVGDQFSKASQPDDDADYTHKLVVELATRLDIFNWAPKQTWLHQAGLTATLGYVATGLPHAGDEIPAGERVYLDSVHSPWLNVGLQLPLTPR